MPRIIPIILLIPIILNACTGRTANPTAVHAVVENTETPSASQTPAPTASPAPTPTPEATATPEPKTVEIDINGDGTPDYNIEIIDEGEYVPLDKGEPARLDKIRFDTVSSENGLIGFDTQRIYFTGYQKARITDVEDENRKAEFYFLKFTMFRENIGPIDIEVAVRADEWHSYLGFSLKHNMHKSFDMEAYSPSTPSNFDSEKAQNEDTFADEVKFLKGNTTALTASQIVKMLKTVPEGTQLDLKFKTIVMAFSSL